MLIFAIMNNVREKLIRVSQLVDGGELERDLALALLREIYEDLKFARPEPEPEPEPYIESEHTVFEVENIAEPPAEPDPEFDPAPTAPAEPDFTPRQPIKPEVIRSLYGDAATLGDALRTERQDLASAAAAAATPIGASLRKSIGLNDRFVMIRDMFRGDTAGFDRTIDQLDRFATLDEAVIWLHDNFALNPDSEGVAMLMNLLERRFS